MGPNAPAIFLTFMDERAHRTRCLIVRLIGFLVVMMTVTYANAQPVHFDRKDPNVYRAIDKDLSLGIGSPGALYVVKGKQFIRIAGADRFESFSIDKTAHKVVVVLGDYTCAGKTRYEWTFGHLAARLENATAFALHQNKDWKSAAAGFARAAALDPTWRIAAYNLASAHQLLGDKPAAIKALAPFLATDPLGTSLDIARDPELAPLLDQPALVAIRSTKPGSAKLTTAGLDGKVLFAPDRNLIAVARVESSWGSSAFTVDVQIWDAATSKLVASTTVVEWGETKNDEKGLVAATKSVVTERMTRLSTQLAALGFRPAAKVEKGVESSDGAKAKIHFAKAKLGLVGPGDMHSAAFTDGVVNVLRKNTTLATAKITGRLVAASFVEEASAIIIEMQRHSSEGCDGGPEVALTVVKI